MFLPGETLTNRFSIVNDNLVYGSIWGVELKFPEDQLELFNERYFPTGLSAFLQHVHYWWSLPYCPGLWEISFEAEYTFGGPPTHDRLVDHSPVNRIYPHQHFSLFLGINKEKVAGLPHRIRIRNGFQFNGCLSVYLLFSNYQAPALLSWYWSMVSGSVRPMVQSLLIKE